jgi:hypothetical protein
MIKYSCQLRRKFPQVVNISDVFGRRLIRMSDGMSHMFSWLYSDSMQMLNYYIRPRQIPHTCTGLDNITTFSPVRPPTKSFAIPHVYFFQIFLRKP